MVLLLTLITLTSACTFHSIKTMEQKPAKITLLSVPSLQLCCMKALKEKARHLPPQIIINSISDITQKDQNLSPTDYLIFENIIPQTIPDDTKSISNYIKANFLSSGAKAKSVAEKKDFFEAIPRICK